MSKRRKVSRKKSRREFSRKSKVHNRNRTPRIQRGGTRF